jgi:hypothetical protein
MPIQRLWSVLTTGGLRDSGKVRAGLHASVDVYARETIIARLEALIQEGYSDTNLRALRGGMPPDLVTLRKKHWPAISEQEAVDLREDLVRYETFGLWRAPEEIVARALGVLTGRPDAVFLLGSDVARSSLLSVLEVVEDEHAFSERFAPAVRAFLSSGGRRPSDRAVQDELANFGQLLGPVARLLRGAHETGLRVIAYQDQPGGDGLTRFLAGELQNAAPRQAEVRPGDAHRGLAHSNGSQGA